MFDAALVFTPNSPDEKGQWQRVSHRTGRGTES